MADDKNTDSAEVFDPGKLEEHGVTIPAPTPTGISIPNPWGPNGAAPDTNPSPADQAPPTPKK